MAAVAGRRLCPFRQDRRMCAAPIPRSTFAIVNRLVVAERIPCTRKRQPLVAPLALTRARIVAARAASEVVEVSTPEATTANPVDPYALEGPTIKVSKAGKARLVAPKIAADARQGNPPPVVCVATEATNNGVKAIAIARSYLEADNIDLTFQPVVRHVGLTKDGKPLTGMVLEIAKAPVQAQAQAPAADDMVEMHVPSKGDHKVIAGALAARVREQKAVCLTAIGPAAVYVAVRTLAKAQQYLRRDDKLIRAVPELVKVIAGDRETNAVRIHVRVESSI